MLTESATETYGSIIQDRAKRFGALWLAAARTDLDDLQLDHQFSRRQI
jgi:hypothetical protein